MPGSVSGKRYAQAIFELAVENGQVDQWANDLGLASQVLQDPEFRAFLEHAEVPLEQKISAVAAVLADVHPLVRNLIDLMVTKGLVGLASELHSSYNELLDIHRGRQRIQVTSAVPLDDAETARVTSFVANLTGKEVVVTTQVDEAIMGGIVIQIGDRLLDGSTRSRLEALRNQIHSEVIVSRS